MNTLIGKYDEALVYYQEALDGNRSTLGNTHPHTLSYITLIGSILQAQGNMYSTIMICQLMISLYVYCNVYLSKPLK